MSDPEARAWNGETMLPCPFCGGTVDPEGWLGREEDPETGDALVRGPECNGCGATTPDMSIWNRRARRLPPAAPGADDAEWLRAAAFAIRKLRQTPESVHPSLDYAHAAIAALAPLRAAEQQRAYEAGFARGGEPWFGADN